LFHVTDDVRTTRVKGGDPRGNHGFPRVEPRVARPQRLNEPRPALVEAGFGGLPQRVNRRLVIHVREEWRVVDRWWTEEPISRRYFDTVLEDGRCAVVFYDGEGRRWFTQN
jgi:hypothetical protein